MLRILSCRLLAITLAITLVGCSSTPTIRPNESIVITERDQTFEITVPVSRVTLYLPRVSFSRKTPLYPGGATANPRYFNFSDNNTGIIVSGWFEPAKEFDGVKEPHATSFDGVPLIYKNITFNKIGDWDIVSYDILLQSINIANIRAHLVRSGTWIELHISGKPDDSLANQRASIRELLKSIQVQERP